MGEIKSTLDLVMERTRHLSMSDDEKARQRKDEYTRRLKGLVQQFADGALAVVPFRERVCEIESEHHVSDRQLLLKSIVEHIDPDGDASRWTDLLTDFEPGSHDALDTALKDYRVARAELVKVGERRQLDHLARHHQIEGSAVVANPSADASVQKGLAALRSQLRERILQAIGAASG